MRILIVTNYYPPHELGGQGRSCQQVVTGLQQRGHSVRVLTSMHGVDNQVTDSGGVRRALYQEMDLTPLWHSLVFFTRRGARVRHNLRELERSLADFQPDIAFIWGMWNMNQAIPALAEARLPGRVAYRFAEYWPLLPSQHRLYWETPARSLPGRLVKHRLLAPLALAQLSREGPPPPLEYRHVVCVSKATRQVLLDGGLPVAGATIIYTGLDADELAFQAPAAPRSPDGPLKLLIAGRLEKEKGVDTAIQALAELRERNVEQVTLSIAGDGKLRYLQHIRQMLAGLGLEQQVTLLGRLPYAEMPALMAANDVLLMPSRWPEPLARVVLEGMLSGLAVVAADIGGTAEIVQDEVNGLLFAAGDSSRLAAKIQRLLDSPELRRRLAECGRQTVLRDFTLEKMLDAYEAFLESAVEPASAA